MTNVDIDALSGRELAMAIAYELGYRWMEFTGRDDSKFKEFLAPGLQAYWQTTAVIVEADEVSKDCPYWPDDIALAWELDGDGWEWDFYERHDRNNDKNPTWLDATLWARSVDVEVEEVLKFSDFPTKAAAYATARCRAWLKAKYAEKGA